MSDLPGTAVPLAQAVFRFFRSSEADRDRLRQDRSSVRRLAETAEIVERADFAWEDGFVQITLRQKRLGGSRTTFGLLPWALEAIRPQLKAFGSGDEIRAFGNVMASLTVELWAGLHAGLFSGALQMWARDKALGGTWVSLDRREWELFQIVDWQTGEAVASSGERLFMVHIVQARAAIAPADVPRAKPRKANASVHKFVERYIAEEKRQGRRPSQSGAEKSWNAANDDARRSQVRAAFKALAGKPLAKGRPRNSPK